MKTNKRWYPYPEISHYFKLKKGVLYAREMRADGSMGAETGYVTLGLFDPAENADEAIPQGVEKELALKE